MYIIKVGSGYVAADGQIVSSQRDALRIDIAGGLRIVKLVPRRVPSHDPRLDSV
jgi:hypothetical protein